MTWDDVPVDTLRLPASDQDRPNESFSVLHRIRSTATFAETQQGDTSSWAISLFPASTLFQDLPQLKGGEQGVPPDHTVIFALQFTFNSTVTVKKAE